MSETMMLRQMRAMMERLDEKVTHALARHHGADRLAFGFPTFHNLGDDTVTNFSLPANQRAKITIKATDAGGKFEALPSGDEFTIENSDPESIATSIGVDASGQPALFCDWLQGGKTDILIEVSDSDGLKSISQLFDTMADENPRALDLDVANAAFEPFTPGATTSASTPIGSSLDPVPGNPAGVVVPQPNTDPVTDPAATAAATQVTANTPDPNASLVEGTTSATQTGTTTNTGTAAAGTNTAGSTSTATTDPATADPALNPATQHPNSAAIT